MQVDDIRLPARLVQELEPRPAVEQVGLQLVIATPVDLGSLEEVDFCWVGSEEQDGDPGDGGPVDLRLGSTLRVERREGGRLEG